MLEHFDVGLVCACHDEHFARSGAAPRRRHVPAAEIARFKRLSDGYHPRGADAIESIGDLLPEALADLGPPGCRARLYRRGGMRRPMPVSTAR